MLSATRRALAAVLSPQGLTGVAVETAWVGVHLALYPWGLLEDRIDEAAGHRVGHLPPVQRGLLVHDVEAAGTPIILLHGVVDNRSIFTVLRRALRGRGFARTYALNYSPLTDDIPTVARWLAEFVEEICANTGYERVHIVGHSMGGIIGRYYVQRLGGDVRVHTLVTLGTPHQGTLGARFIPWPVIRQLRLASPVLRELAEPAPGCRTRFIAIWSDLDQIVVPQRNARIAHPDLRSRNVLFRGIGHMSLPFDRRVAREIAFALAQLDHDGSQITVGTTSIASTTGRRQVGEEGVGRGTQPASGLLPG